MIKTGVVESDGLPPSARADLDRGQWRSEPRSRLAAAGHAATPKMVVRGEAMITCEPLGIKSLALLMSH
ncbi:hypothetical protein GCM10010095_12370 [Streptomyces anthocyanicus]|nr:hypothetical protein GCM10010095_12370 [Streptomyces anthocyanicus]